MRKGVKLDTLSKNIFLKNKILDFKNLSTFVFYTFSHFKRPFYRYNYNEK